MSSAPDLVQGAVQDFFGGLGASYAAPQVFAQSLQFRFDGHGSITAPSIIPQSTDIGFVAEGQPIPVRQMTMGGVTLAPSRFKTIVVFNREVFEHTTPTVEKIVDTALMEAVGQASDSVAFGNLAATATQPMGFRYGVTETPHESTASGATRRAR